MAAEFIPVDAPPAVHAQGVLDTVAANPDGSLHDIENVAREPLGLTEDQSNQLFFIDDDHAPTEQRAAAQKAEIDAWNAYLEETQTDG